jgi:predicted Zn-dependent peptidase
VNRRRSFALAIVFATCVAAVTAVQQAPDRSKPPAIGAPPALHVPAIEKRTLSNGLHVSIVSAHKVPLVHLELAVKAGSGIDPAKKFGLASLTADMLDEGAGTRSALEIADAIDYLGADLTTRSTEDASFVELKVPSARLRDALPIMGDVVVRPTFQDTELERVRKDRLTTLLQAEDDPEQLIEIAFPRILYGPTHQYGTSEIGTATSLGSLTAADLKTFHSTYYRPGNAELVVAGDVAPDTLQPMLEQAFGGWTGTASPPAPPPAPPAPSARKVFLIDKPGAAQSQIRIGTIGVARSTPDYFPLRVMNTILGGAFTSRLNANLREQHGYAYGASSSFDMRLGAGPFYATAGVQTDKTTEALKEFFNELKRIHEPVPTDELEKAANYLSLLLPRNFETTGGVATSLSLLYVYGLPDDFYATYRDRVRAVTPADVKRVADKYIVPDKLTVVVIGDRKTIEAGMRALNLGPVSVVETADVVK